MRISASAIIRFQVAEAMEEQKKIVGENLVLLYKLIGENLVLVHKIWTQKLACIGVDVEMLKVYTKQTFGISLSLIL